ncbi:unnamed protein product [Lepidochelys olivacea]
MGHKRNICQYKRCFRVAAVLVVIAKEKEDLWHLRDLCLCSNKFISLSGATSPPFLLQYKREAPTSGEILCHQFKRKEGRFEGIIQRYSTNNRVGWILLAPHSHGRQGALGDVAFTGERSGAGVRRSLAVGSGNVTSRRCLGGVGGLLGWAGWGRGSSGGWETEDWAVSMGGGHLLLPPLPGPPQPSPCPWALPPSARFRNHSGERFPPKPGQVTADCAVTPSPPQDSGALGAERSQELRMNPGGDPSQGLKAAPESRLSLLPFLGIKFKFLQRAKEASIPHLN